MRLSKITEDDLEFARRLRNQFRQWFFMSEGLTRDQQLLWYQGLITSPEVDFRIIVVGAERVGTISLTNRSDGRIEIGNVIIAYQHQGKGYAKQAVKMQLAPTRTYFSRVKPENVASKGLFQGLGFIARTDVEWELFPLAQEC